MAINLEQLADEVYGDETSLTKLADEVYTEGGRFRGAGATGEWEPQRGRIAETGIALGRGFLGLAEDVLSTSQRFSPLWGEYGLRGVLKAREPIDELTKQQALQETGGGVQRAAELIRKKQQASMLTGMIENIESAYEKLPRTRSGLGGWALNVLGEGAPRLMVSMATGAETLAGPLMVGFISGGEQAYKRAKTGGASEKQALLEYGLGGLAEAALEMWGVSRLLKFKSAGAGSLTALVKNVRKKLWKQAAGNLKNITGNMLKSALVEGLEESTQQGASIAIPGLLRGDIPRKADGNIDWLPILGEIGEAGAGGALLGGIVPFGMNVPAGAVEAAAPSMAKIEQVARRIQENPRLGEIEKARAIQALKELVPAEERVSEERPAKAEERPTRLYHGTGAKIANIIAEGIKSDKTRTGAVSATDNPQIAKRFGDVVEIVLPSGAENRILDLTDGRNEARIVREGFPIGKWYNSDISEQSARLQTLVGFEDLTKQQKRWLADKGYIGIKIPSLEGGLAPGTETRFVGNIPASWVHTFKAEFIKRPSVFEIPEATQKTLDMADRLGKTLTEMQSRRREFKKEVKKGRSEVFALQEETLKAQKENDPLTAKILAQQAAQRQLRAEIGEMMEPFSQEDYSALTQAVNETTSLNMAEKNNLWSTLDDLFIRKVPPPESSLKLFDEFFGTDIMGTAKDTPQTKWQKLIRWTAETSGVLKAMLACFDASAGGIQAWKTAFIDPKSWFKGVGRGWRAISDEYTRLRNIEVKTNPYYGLARSVGLPFTEVGSHTKGEEYFQSQVAHKIPGYGPIVNLSDKIWTTTLNSIRADMFYKACEAWDGSGASYQQYEEMAHHIANLTGRGKGDPKGWFEKHMDVWSTAFWTPRLVRAEVASVFDWATKPHIRKIAAANIIQAFGLMSGLLGLLSLIPGVEVEDDPTSTDVYKVKIGRTRLNPLGRIQQLLRLTAQFAMGKTKSLKTGRISDTERHKIVTRFIRGKLNPSIGMGIDIATGKTFMGEKTRLEPEFITKYIAEHITPMFLQDMHDAIRYQGLGNMTLLTAPLAVHGIGAQTYETTPMEEAMNLKNQLAHQHFGTEWDQLGPEAQEALQLERPAIQRFEDRASYERENFGFLGPMQEQNKEAGRRIQKSLPGEVQIELERFAIDVGALSRRIGQDWYLNQNRYEEYQKNLKSILQKTMPELIASPTWKEFTPEIQKTMLESLIGDAKKYIRQEIVNKANAEDYERWPAR